MTFRSYLPWFLARIFLGGIFVLAGFIKLTEPIEVFRGQILAYGMIPYAWVGMIASVLPWIEFLAGVCLLSGYFPRQAASILALLAASFVGLIGLAALKGTLPENCGCFGEGFHISPYQMAALDTLNFLLGVKLARMPHRCCIAGG